MTLRQLTAQELSADPLDAAKLLLGSVLSNSTTAGTVAVRVVEVEAYGGIDDPASHAFRGKTTRNQVMFGPAGRLYVYFIYGMHFCINVVCYPQGQAGAVLIRAGEVITGLDIAQARKPLIQNPRLLASGPARLTAILDITKAHNGIDLTDPGSPIQIFAPEEPIPPANIVIGPRVGITAAADRPWRLWLDSPAVSRYRAGTVKRA